MADTFPTIARVRQYLHAKGMIDDVTPDFANQIAWDLFGASLAQALRDTKAFPSNAEGAQAYLDGLLAIGPAEAAKTLPLDNPIRRVSIRAVELVNARIDAVLASGEG